jgi:hypothetical protein
MAIAEFPLPSVSSSNPTPNVWLEMPQEFQVGFTSYDDGGRDFKLQNGGNGIRRWRLLYTGLNVTTAAILDNHAASAKLNADGLSAISFNYRDRDATLYAGVRYESYERVQHVKLNNQQRVIALVKFP